MCVHMIYGVVHGVVHMAQAKPARRGATLRMKRFCTCLLSSQNSLLDPSGDAKMEKTAT